MSKWDRFSKALQLPGSLSELAEGPPPRSNEPAAPVIDASRRADHAIAGALRVTTDKDDYAPGETAVITVTGLQPGATVLLEVQHVDGPGPDGIYGTLDDSVVDLGGAGHEPWFAVDGGAGDREAAADGRVVTTWYVNPDDSLDERFLLTARELAAAGPGDSRVAPTGRVASATFTDGGKVYQHWADGDADKGTAERWNNNILSDVKSDYFEGESIPHVFTYQASNSMPLVQGETYTFTITYDYYQQNTNAGGFSGLTTYDVSREPATGIDGEAPSEFESDGIFYFDADIEDYSSGEIDITDVSEPVSIGSGNLQQQVTVTFVYTGPTTTSGSIDFYFGLHIAEPGAVPEGSGETEGAHAWTGGSLQTSVSIEGSGASSLQLAPSAIIVGEISGYKFEDTDGDGQRDQGEQGLAGWTIYIDSDDDGTLDWADNVVANGLWDPGEGERWTLTDVNGFYSFSVTPDADKTDADNDPYIIREVLKSGYVQTAPDDSDPNDGKSASYSVTISPTDPTETGVNFGNQLIPAPSVTLNIDKVTYSGTYDSTTARDNVTILAGENVTWRYAVSISGLDASLSETAVIDDLTDDQGVTPVYASGDSNGNNKLDTGEIWIYKASGTAIDTSSLSNDLYVNTGTVDVTVTGDGGTITPSANDPSSYKSFTPDIQIVKTGTLNDGDDGQADKGDTVTYSFAVTTGTTGTAPLKNVQVTDSLVPTITAVDDDTDGFNDGDTDTDGELDPGETWQYTGSYALTQDDIDSGSVSNTATAKGTFEDDFGNSDTPKDTDTFVLTLVQNPGITIDKKTNGTDDAGNVAKGSTVTWTYAVKNTGNVTLDNLSVTDDNGTPGDSDDFNPDPVLNDNGTPSDPTDDYIEGDTDKDGLLDPEETWTYTATGTAAAGDYDNTATVDAEDPSDNDVSDTDSSGYFGVDSSIQVVKQTNGQDDGGLIEIGTAITWTYDVTNMGNVALGNLSVTDDNGTPGDPSDDFSPDPIVNDNGTQTPGDDYIEGDTDKDGEFDPGETWQYASSGTAEAGSYANTAIVTADDPLDTQVSDTDTSSYFGTQPPIEFTGNPQFNFPNDVSKIQPKLQGGSFTINPGATIYWDIFTSDYANARIDPDSVLAGYGLDAEIVEIWQSGNEAVWRIFVTNQSDSDVSLANNTDIVSYDTILTASSDKSKLDLVNADPLIANFNNFSNIENALTKTEDGFIFPGGDDPLSVSTTGGIDKVWASTDKTGTLDVPEDPISPAIDGLAGGDLIYGVNQAEGVTETLRGGADDDTIDGRGGDDELYGEGGDDLLYGGNGSDTLYGGDGDDVLIGSYGIDHYHGGGDNDTFVLEPGAFDVIHDFGDGTDTILFGDFDTSNGAQGLVAGDFLADSDTTLATGTEVFFYNTATGLLFFDADGLGANGLDDGDMVLIASLSGAPTLAAGDISFDPDLLV